MSGRMWRVVAVFRIVTLIYAAILSWQHHAQYAHPAGADLALAVMCAWTAITVVAFARPAGRTPLLVTADVLVAVGLILSTRWIETAAQLAAGTPTVPTSWATSAVLSCAVAGGPWPGLAGGIAVAGADLVAGQAVFPQTTVLIAGALGGYVVRLGLEAETAVDRVARTEAAMAERDRIARGIHDSVLQVLALVASRGKTIGGEAAELGRLAAEQETALRALVSAAHAEPETSTGLVDVRAGLELLASASITVACPATPVWLPAVKAAAMCGAAQAAVDNVRRHAGVAARGWVLLADDGTHVLVSIRDDGAGFAPGRLAEAAGAGRLGVSHSIVGRLREAGGTAVVTCEPGQGTEVELRVPA